MRSTAGVPLHVIAATCLAVACSSGSDGEDLGSNVEEITVNTSATYAIVGVQSGKCVQPAGGSTAGAAVAQIATCNGAKSQQYRLEASGSGFRIRNVNSSLCLGVNGGSTANGATIVQSSCGTATSQQFTFTDVTSGVERITNVNSGKVFDVAGLATADGTGLQQFTWANGSNQKFSLNVVSASTPPPPPASGLPIPPTSGVPRPSGTPGHLTVLSWAGFKAAVSFTFDDSQPSQIEHYSELHAVGVPMTFYLSSGDNGTANYDATWTAAARNGDELGNHTAHHCHADGTGCSFGTWSGSVASELDACSSYISSHYPQSGVFTSASPFGDTGYDGAAAARFFINRGVAGGSIGANDATDPFNLPIHLAASGETAASFNAVTDGNRSAGKWLIFLIHSITPTTATWFNPVAISDVTGSMSHAKSLSDVWTGTVSNIGAYWRAQKLLTTAFAAGGSTFTWTLPAHFPAGKFVRVKVDGGTLSQQGRTLTWSDHGYYEVSLDAKSLTLSP
jgi:hypothetical protein